MKKLKSGLMVWAAIMAQVIAFDADQLWVLISFTLMSVALAIIAFLDI